MSARLDGIDWLRRGPLARLLDILDRDGEEARVVGGAVRNALLGEPVHEFDVATTATPDIVVARAAAAGFKSAPTGIEHGTVTVIVDGHPFEVTTLRQDVETYGRKAKVAFGRDWRVDAERRDFTINALSASRDGTLYDYTNGLADLKARRVRFIGDPAARIAEDYLRILRFFRFHASYGAGAPDAAGLAACIKAHTHLNDLSRERVRMELLKLIVARGALSALTAMSEAGLLQMLLADVPDLASFSQMIAAETAFGLASDPVRRLGALGVNMREDAERLHERLRLSNTERDRLISMSEGWHELPEKSADQNLRALLYRLQPEPYLDRVLLAYARAPQVLPEARWREIVELPQHWTAPAFPLRAGDVMARGVEKGPKLGAVLRAAEDAWIAADFPAGKAAHDAILDAALRMAKSAS